VRARWLPLLLGVAIAASCSTGPSTGASKPAAQPVTVLAASSLRAAFAAAGRAYQASHPGTSVSFGFDASSALRTKIEQGAPADLFASADVTNAQKLVDDGYAIGPPQPFAGNRLAIVVPLDNPALIQTPADLAKPGVRVVAASEGVPITAYATQLIARLAGQAGYPGGYATKVAANVASREDNVAAVVAKVAIGEGDAGIVYGTDALASPRLKEVPIPTGANVSVTYAAVVVKTSSRTDAALAFLAWLRGSTGQATLARFGFVAP
jgi:molybdate transport system substrate-binding protein